MVFSGIKNVRLLDETPPAYLVNLHLEVGGEVFEDAELCVRAGGGGICDDVLAEITAGNYSGSITNYTPPPAPLPHERPLTQSQWIWALEAYGLYDPLNAAIAAQPTSVKAILRAKAFHKQHYFYEDVLAMLVDYADILPEEVSALTEADIQAIWVVAIQELQ